MKRAQLARKTPLRSKPHARPERERAPLVLVPRPAGAPKAVMASAAAPQAPAPKDGRYISEAWRRAVAGLPCVFCGQPSQAAHRNEGKGLGLKTDDCLTAAICPREHAEIDQGSGMTREQRRARMDEAIVLTVRALVRAGKVVLA